MEHSKKCYKTCYYVDRYKTPQLGQPLLQGVLQGLNIVHTIKAGSLVHIACNNQQLYQKCLPINMHACTIQAQMLKIPNIWVYETSIAGWRVLWWTKIKTDIPALSSCSATSFASGPLQSSLASGRQSLQSRKEPLG